MTTLPSGEHHNFAPGTVVRVVSPRVAMFWRLLLGFHTVYCGVGYAFGPPKWYSSPSLELVRQWTPWPIPVTGLLLFVLAALILSPWPKVRLFGHWVAFIQWVYWAIALFGTVITGSITGWGGPAHVLIVACVHAFQLGPRYTIPRPGGSRGPR